MGIRFNQLHVGDTWSFTVDGGEYEAGTWTLTLWLVPRFSTPTQAVIEITSVPDSDDATLHLFAQDPAVTATYKAGMYSYYTTASDGTDRFTLDASKWSGEVELLADPSALAQGHDGRSDAQKALDDARAAYYTWVGTNGHIKEYEINGRRMVYGSAGDILRHISVLKMEVTTERTEEARRRGLASPRHVYQRIYRA